MDKKELPEIDLPMLASKGSLEDYVMDKHLIKDTGATTALSILEETSGAEDSDSEEEDLTPKTSVKVLWAGPLNISAKMLCVIS